MSSRTVGRTAGVTLVGMDGFLVDIEVLTVPNLPAFVLVGLPDAALGESRDRVRAAFAASGFAWPQARVTVNLSPAAIPKSGSHFDLGIAIAVLVATEDIDGTLPSRAVHLGELGLDGRVRPVRGILPAVYAAVAAGRTRVVVPRANLAEAQLVPGAQVVGVDSLADLARRYGADMPVEEHGEDTDDHAGSSGGADCALAATVVPRGGGAPGGWKPTIQPDMREVLGQGEARYALEVAAAGGHHMLMLGAPGAGKTMLAARLPGLLPDLTEQEAVEVTAIHSVAGSFDATGGLISRPPFEDPHHTATTASMVGGGSGLPRPGAASRAHRGVLFMDEAPEFSPRVLQTLRQPLEEGWLMIQRARGVARYPARFQLVLAANPCPCGKGGGRALDCECTAAARRRYFSRLSGPLLDRIDVQVDMAPVSRVDVAGLACDPEPEDTATIAARVLRARQAARQRLEGTGWSHNAHVPGSWIRAELDRRHGAGTAWLTKDLNRAMDLGLLSLRGVDRVLRVAWTIADLEQRDVPTQDDISRALHLRTRGHLGG